MDPPRGKSPYGSEPTRPKDTPRLKGWPESPRIDAQQAAANQYNDAAQAHAAKVQGKAAIRADLEKANGRPPAQAQARDRAAVPNTEPVRGKAGIQADLYKAMQSQQQPSGGPSRGGGRGR